MLGTGCLVGLALGCGQGEKPRSSPGAEPFVNAMPGSEDPAADAELVFAEDQVHTYALELSATDWAGLQANARDEEYAAASLSVDGELVGQVGLRFKGSYGSLALCFDATGQRTCPKLSMKLKFDKYDPGRRYHGLERLNFNSMRSDPSQLHERLAYRLFRAMGIAAPRAGHARLVVNGENQGLFSLVEQVDGHFTDDRFEGGDGNLYKEQWPSLADAASLDEQLETNEEAPDHSVLLGFRAELVGAVPDALPGVVERYMDVDASFAYLAVDRTISNWDGISTFYCGDAACYNHNYYLYQHEREPRFTLIPWDLDNTFAVSTPLDDVPSPLSLPADCAVHYPAFGMLTVMAPGCDPLLQGLARSDPARYRAQLTRLLEGPFAQSGLGTWLDTRVAQLEPAVAGDPYGPGVPAFRNAVETLRHDLGLLALRAGAERDGNDVERFRLDVDALNDFEAATPLGLRLGAAPLSAPESSFDVALGQGDALAGHGDLVLSFEFRDSREPWAQWARLTLRFGAAGSIDLNAKATLHLVVQADAPRTLRISFDSASYTQPESGATFGWDVSLDGTRQEIDLPLSSATYPSWGPVVPETRQSVLARATAVLFDPAAAGRNDDGYLGAGKTDPGQIRIDEIQFLP
jgi:spore coat protein H